MTDMYAFYRFFMKPKKDPKNNCTIQQNIILHGGNNHIKNLENLLKNVFNRPYELARRVIKYDHVSKIYMKEYNNLYTLNHIKNGLDIKKKHQDEIKSLLNTSFGPNTHNFEDPNVEYILILENDIVIGCFYFCFFPYAENMIRNLREKHPSIKKDDIYIYNLTISSYKRGKKYCNYLISCALCYLQNMYKKQNIWLIAENQNHPDNTSSKIAANRCYSNFMKAVHDKKERYIYYVLKSKYTVITHLPDDDNTASSDIENISDEKLNKLFKYVSDKMKATCDNKNYIIIDTNCTYFPQIPQRPQIPHTSSISIIPSSSSSSISSSSSSSSSSSISSSSSSFVSRSRGRGRR